MSDIDSEFRNVDNDWGGNMWGDCRHCGSTDPEHSRVQCALAAKATGLANESQTPARASTATPNQRKDK